MHALLVLLVGRDELCRWFCRFPGVAPVAAFTFKAAIDDPARFAKSKTVGTHFGLTPRREQSGTSVDIDGQISEAGGGQVRTALYEAASAMITRSQRQCALKAYLVRLCRTRGTRWRDRCGALRPARARTACRDCAAAAANRTAAQIVLVDRGWRSQARGNLARCAGLS